MSGFKNRLNNVQRMGIGTADDTTFGKLCAFPGRNLFIPLSIHVVCPCTGCRAL